MVGLAFGQLLGQPGDVANARTRGVREFAEGVLPAVDERLEGGAGGRSELVDGPRRC
ncbi:hypothetical protein [Streptomyces abikoensis]|uniref:hypothetical protein n=1 Tax=Streptomyces abikoensis TaxID=97398 RepID=UPI00340088E4